MPVEFNPEAILADEKNFVCTCFITNCQWHGKCRECAALHRYINTVPNCFTAPKEA